jgi:hypothetical protein
MEKIKKINFSLKLKARNKKGYAILFTVILVSIISLIGIGLSNVTYKQLMLSSGAKDSQVSFYTSDMATECALYADLILKIDETDEGSFPINNFSCGLDRSGGSFSFTISRLSQGGDDLLYKIEPLDPNSSDPCFRIEIDKKQSGDKRNTVVRASGYNICNKNHPRTVERTIQVKY